MCEDNDRRILVLDTSASTRQVLEVAVREAGFEPEFLAEAGSVVDLALYLRPSAIIATVFPPRLLGLMLCRQLRGNPRTGMIPIFITSILSLEEEALEAGAAGFFFKPLQPDEVVQRLRALIPPER
jgi:PleD family two-component response regulator